MRLRKRTNGKGGVIAAAVGLAAGALLLRSVLPDLRRYINMSRM